MMVSIVILTRNEDKRIGDCLDSLLNRNDKSNFEILVVDGQSHDNTVAIVQKYVETYDNVQLIRCDGYGYSLQRNIGARNAKGKYVLYISGDAYASKNLLDRYLKYCELEYDVVQGSILNIPNRTYFSKVMQHVYPIIYPVIQDSHLESISTVNILIRKELLLEFHFNEEVKSLEDKEWYFRLEQNRQIKYTRCLGAVVNHHIHETFRQYTRKIYREAIAIGQVEGINRLNKIQFQCFDWRNMAIVSLISTMIVFLLFILNVFGVIPTKYTSYASLIILTQLFFSATLIARRDRYKRTYKHRISAIWIICIYIIAISIGYIKGFSSNILHRSLT